MKKVFKALFGLMATVFFAVASVSCSKDDTNKTDENNLVGKWQSTSFNLKTYEAGTGKLTYDETEGCVNWYIGLNLLADGTGQYIDFEEEESWICQMTWVVMDSKLLITLEEEGVKETLTFGIESVGKNSMVLTRTDEYSDDGVKMKDVTTYTFKKL